MFKKTIKYILLGLLLIFVVDELIGVARAVLPVFWTSSTGFQARGVPYSQLAIPYNSSTGIGAPQVDGTSTLCLGCSVGVNNVCVAGAGNSQAEMLNGVWICGVINASIIGAVPDPMGLNKLVAIGSNPTVTGYNTDAYHSLYARGGTNVCSMSTTTATFTSGSPTVTLAGGHDFQVNNGIFALGVGAACVINGASCASTTVGVPTIKTGKMETKTIPSSPGPYTVVINDSGANDVTDDLGVGDGQDNFPFLLNEIIHYGYTVAIVGGVATYTFLAGDAGRSVNISYAISGAGPGTTPVTMTVIAIDNSNGGYTSAPTAVTYTTAPAALSPTQFMYFQVPAVTGAYRYVWYENDNNGGQYIAAETWTNSFKQYGQVATSDEYVPATAPATAATNDAYTGTITSLVGNVATMDTNAGASLGGVTVKHDSTAAFANSLTDITANPKMGGAIIVPVGGKCRAKQITFPVASLGVYIIGSPPDAAVGNDINSPTASEILLYGDGGGPVNSLPNVHGGIVFPQATHSGLYNLAIAYDNGALDTVISDMGSSFNSVNLFNNMINWDGSTVDTHSGTNTTGIDVNLAAGEFSLNYIINVQQGMFLGGGVNALWVHGGSIRNVYPGKFFKAMIGLSAGQNNTIGPDINFENPWNAIHSDIAPWVTTQGVRLSNNFGLHVLTNYMADIGANHGVNPQGILIDLTAAQGTIITGALVTCAVTGNNLWGIRGIAGAANPMLTVLGWTETGCGKGIDSAIPVSAMGVDLIGLPTNGVGFDIHNTGFLAGNRVQVAGGATGTTAYKLGYAPDGTCNTISAGQVVTETTNNNTTKIVDGCSSANLKWGVVIDGKPGTVTAPTAGTGTASVAANSNNYAGTFTVSASVTASATITFATDFPWAVTPKCIVSDKTSIQALKVTPSTTTLVVAAATDFGGDVISYQCEQ